MHKEGKRQTASGNTKGHNKEMRTTSLKKRQEI